MPCVYSVIRHRWRQNVARKKNWKTKRRRVGHWCSHAFILPTSLGFKKKKGTFDTAFVVIRCLPFPHLPTKPPTHRSIPPHRGSRNKIKNLIFVPRSPDDVYPPLREEEQDDYLLNSLDMDLSSTSVIPPVSHVAKSRG